MIRKLMLLALALTLAFGLMPLLLALGGSAVAGALGCGLNEGAVHSCPVLGLELGGVLYSFFVLGWFGMVTLPVSAMVLVVWILVALVLIAIDRNRRRRAI